jgi:hypothetical protein
VPYPSDSPRHALPLHAPPVYQAQLPPLPKKKDSEQVQAERGRYVDVFVACVFIVFGSVRMASELSDKTTTDGSLALSLSTNLADHASVIGVVQGALWIVRAGGHLSDRLILT